MIESMVSSIGLTRWGCEPMKNVMKAWNINIWLTCMTILIILFTSTPSLGINGWFKPCTHLDTKPTLGLSTKPLKDGRNYASDPSLRKNFLWRARCVLETTEKVGWNVGDLLFPPLTFWENFRIENRARAWDPVVLNLGLAYARLASPTHPSRTS